jgi:hypothetical protein
MKAPDLISYMPFEFIEVFMQERPMVFQAVAPGRDGFFQVEHEPALHMDPLCGGYSGERSPEHFERLVNAQPFLLFGDELLLPLFGDAVVLPFRTGARFLFSIKRSDQSLVFEAVQERVKGARRPFNVPIREIVHALYDLVALSFPRRRGWTG